jgi:membrane protein required for colicin V production
VDALNAADWTIISVVGVSMTLSVLRGFVREALSLLGWVLAFVVAMLFSERFAWVLAGSIQDDTSRHVVAFAILFVVTLVAVALLARLLQSFIQFVGLGFLDRILGMAFGFARGVFVLLAVIAVSRPLLAPERYDWWQESLLLPHLLLMEGWFRDLAAVVRGLLAGIGN